MIKRNLASTADIKEIDAGLNEHLQTINDNELLDILHEDFTVDINGHNVSLGCMDTYDAFCRFLQTAAENNEVANNINKQNAANDNFQDAHQYIEEAAEQLTEVMSEPLPDISYIVIDGKSYPLPTWSADVQHILDTAMKSIAVFAKSQYEA